VAALDDSVLVQAAVTVATRRIAQLERTGFMIVLLQGSATLTGANAKRRLAYSLRDR